MKNVLLRAAAAGGMAAALALSGPAQGVLFTDVYTNSFEPPASLGGWSITSAPVNFTSGGNPYTIPGRSIGTDETPSGRWFLGQFGANDQASLNLDLSLYGTGPKSVKLEFDAFLLRSWDGNLVQPPVSDALLGPVPVGPDIFGVRYASTGGQQGTLLHNTFSQGIPEVGQSYCAGVMPQCGPTWFSDEKNTLGYHYTISPTGIPVPVAPENAMDMVYRFNDGTSTHGNKTFFFDVTGDSLTITFYSQNLQLRAQEWLAANGVDPGSRLALLDESWGLDNVRVEVAAVPEPGTYALIAAGLVAVLLISRRRMQARA